MGEIGNHHRDIEGHKWRRRANRHHRRQRQKQNRNQRRQGSSSSDSNNKDNSKQKSQRCWDWMIVGGTNHYAKNRSMFTTYTRAPTKIRSLRVLGVGTVKLNMSRAPDDPGSIYTLELKNVLHIPEAICNGISINPGFMDENNFGISFRDLEIYEEDSREKLWYGVRYCGEPRAVLAGDPRGETFLEEGGVYSLSLEASDGELETLARRAETRSLS